MDERSNDPSRRAWLTRAVAGGAALCVHPWALAASEKWPTRAITFIVPFNAGGATDILARLLASRLSDRLGQTIVVENRVGASGILGTDATARAPADGYTFTVSLTTNLLLNQFLYSKLPYDPRRDLVLVSLLARAPVTLVVHPDVPASDAPSLLAYIKANKGKLSYGSWGVGSHGHLACAYMSRTQDADMIHAPYKGEAPMLQDLIGGRIQLAFASALGSKPQIDAGKLKLIGVTGKTRMDILPDGRTLFEQGLTDDAYSVVGWSGMAAPARTPPALVQRMATELAAVAAMPDVRARVADIGFSVVASSPEAFVQAYDQDLPIWENLVKVSGARLD